MRDGVEDVHFDEDVAEDILRIAEFEGQPVQEVLEALVIAGVREHKKIRSRVRDLLRRAAGEVPR
jgi:hypothetical protein